MYIIRFANDFIFNDGYFVEFAINFFLGKKNVKTNYRLYTKFAILNIILVSIYN